LILAYTWYVWVIEVITPEVPFRMSIKEYQTEHFDIYYSEEFFTQQEIGILGLKTWVFIFDQKLLGY